MARNTGPRLRRQRTCGKDLELISLARSVDTKCKHEQAPGQHGHRRSRSPGVYGEQLREKQSLRHMYGVLEKQFRRYFKEAARRPGMTGDNLLHILESRLDNVVFRLGFGSTRAESRQLVRHKAIEIAEILSVDENGKNAVHGEWKVVNIPSFQVSPGSKVRVREKSKNQDRIKRAVALRTEQSTPVEWVELDSKALSGIFKYLPEHEQLPSDINVQLVVELYSK